MLKRFTIHPPSRILESVTVPELTHNYQTSSDPLPGAVKFAPSRRQVAGIILVCLALYIGGAYANDQQFVKVRAGKLTIKGDLYDTKLMFNGKKLYDGNGFILSFVDKYVLDGKDVVLLTSNSGGTGCPVMYFFVTITSQGAASLSPQFGTCSDLARPVLRGSKIIITMPRITGNGDAKYVYKNGIVTEDGKPVK